MKTIPTVIAPFTGILHFEDAAFFSRNSGRRFLCRHLREEEYIKHFFPRPGYWLDHTIIIEKLSPVVGRTTLFYGETLHTLDLTDADLAALTSARSGRRKRR